MESMSMTPELSAALIKAGGLVLQDWAFLMVEPDDNDGAALRETTPLLYATTRFHNGAELVCSVSILCGHAVARLVCENVLGVDGSNESDCTDALRELANVFAGHFVTEYFGVDEPFELRPPEVKSIDEVGVLLDVENVSFFLADDEAVAFIYNGECASESNL